MPKRTHGDERGMVAVFIAIGLLAFLSIAALVVDLGFGLTVKTQLQEVADAAAMAAVVQLNGTAGGELNATAAAQYYASQNKAASHVVNLQAGDIEFGSWDMAVKVFSVQADPADVSAVRVTANARRATDDAGPLKTTFAKVFGATEMEVMADAVAEVMGAACLEGDCVIDLPIVLCDTKLVDDDGDGLCQFKISVQPTYKEEGALTSFFLPNGNANNISDYVDGGTNGDIISPSVFTMYPKGDTCDFHPDMDPVEKDIVELNEGTLVPVFNTLQDEYDLAVAPCENKSQDEIDTENSNLEAAGESPLECSDIDGDAYQDEDTGDWFNYEWNTYVMVAWCSEEPGATLSQGACIKGFARFGVEEVCTAGGYECRHELDGNGEPRTGIKGLYGFVECDGGGGGSADPLEGTLARIPGLVE